MTVVDSATMHPMLLRDARIEHDYGRPWRLRLYYAGPNMSNQSGRSDKWWEARSHNGLPDTAFVRYGRTGAIGATTETSVQSAFVRASEKLRKGYLIETSAVQAAPPLASLQGLVNSSTWRSASESEVLNLAATHGFVALDIDQRATLQGGLTVSAYVASDGSLWGLALNLGYYYFSRLRAYG